MSYIYCFLFSDNTTSSNNGKDSPKSIEENGEEMKLTKNETKAESTTYSSTTAEITSTTIQSTSKSTTMKHFNKLSSIKPGK